MSAEDEYIWARGNPFVALSDMFMDPEPLTSTEIENARLRQNAEWDANVMNILEDCNGKLKSENTDLRELLLDTWHLLQEVHGRNSIEMGVATRMAKLHRRMVKLGVEQ